MKNNISQIVSEYFDNISLKHLQGQHNQKRHGWRYGGGIRQIRQGMRSGISENFQGTTSEQERSEYRNRIANLENKPAGWQSSEQVNIDRLGRQMNKPIYGTVAPAPKKGRPVGSKNKPKSSEEKYLLKLIGRRTPSYSEVSDYLSSHNEFHNESGWKKWHNSLSSDEVWALKEYTSYNFVGSGINFSTRPFAKLNTALRQGTFDASAHPRSERTKLATNLDVLLEKSPGTHKDMMLFRGFGSDRMFNQVLNGQVKRGDVFSDLGYVSTSPTRDTANKFHMDTMSMYQGKKPVYMRIKAPKGTKGAYISHQQYNGYMDNTEFLMPRGTKYVIENVGFEMVNGYNTAVFDVIAITE